MTGKEYTIERLNNVMNSYGWNDTMCRLKVNHREIEMTVVGKIYVLEKTIDFIFELAENFGIEDLEDYIVIY